MPVRVEDHYVLETSDLETARSGRQHFEVHCLAAVEFIAVGTQQTRVAVRHEHKMTGGRWLWRWKRRQRDYILHRDAFSRQVEQCSKALGHSDNPHPDDRGGG